MDGRASVTKDDPTDKVWSGPPSGIWTFTVYSFATPQIRSHDFWCNINLSVCMRVCMISSYSTDILPTLTVSN